MSFRVECKVGYDWSWAAAPEDGEYRTYNTREEAEKAIDFMVARYDWDRRNARIVEYLELPSVVHFRLRDDVDLETELVASFDGEGEVQINYRILGELRVRGKEALSTLNAARIRKLVLDELVEIGPPN